MKRANLPFDTKHFEKLKKQGINFGTELTFHEIYRSNHWSGDKSVSGPGSDRDQTREISIQIPGLVRELKVTQLLDIPCGDFHWFGKMDMELDSYTGGDIVAELVDKNQRLHSNNSRKFIKINLISDPLPEADILLCRDCLVHFSNEDIIKTIDNVKRSNIRFLLTTTFTQCEKNFDIETGDWRVINLEKPPFCLPSPLKLINEKCTEGNGTYSDKSLGLWKIKDL